jgi:hypothetical protein
MRCRRPESNVEKEQSVDPLIVALAAVLVVVGGIASYLDVPTRQRGRVSIIRTPSQPASRS